MIEYETIIKFLSKNECDSILNFCKTNLILNKGIIRNKKDSPELDENARKSNVAFTSKFIELNDKIINILNNKIKIKNYEIEINPNFQFTEYKTGEYYNWHADGPEKETEDERYCSIVIQLNDEYTGGDLQLKNYNDIITFERGVGNLFIFLSKYTHRVSEIKSGVRYSLVNWYNLKKKENFNKTLI
jgi:predicted 2-oxoglutarate/Fe(II)-dependent dioxygenase YbiX